MHVNKTAIGKEAEEKAAKHLRLADYTILARNWRTRRCEIDIVALKNKIIYFIEVKSRSRLSQGRSIEYITPQKRRQMEFAASVWVARQRWRGSYELCVVGVDGPRCEIELIESI